MFQGLILKIYQNNIKYFNFNIIILIKNALKKGVS